MNRYENIQLVVPGHGDVGDKSLLSYTLELLQIKERN